MERTVGILSLIGAGETEFEESAGAAVSAGAERSVGEAMLCFGGYTVDRKSVV